MSRPESETVDFGFRRVGRKDKDRLVRGVFDSVSDRYDLMNDLMSGGLHRLWKDAYVARLAPRPGERVLDVAGGTGDIAFRIVKRGARATVCDINASMVARGRDRGLDRGLIAGLDWLVGSAEALPVPDRSVDAVTCAFGLRNMTDIPKALSEMVRVLKPGGRFLCLEFSRPASAIGPLYDFYSFKLLPVIGTVVAEDGPAYRYLAESIRRFPDQEKLVGLMKAAGFARPRFENLALGIVAIHSGWRD
ncbi:MAG: class I SAM-dependent methyltransferase [Alphaproteobacteria bacterium]|nr:class I SAM-dependent methyltransferase [Alphaproteobacteria bacterium]